MGEGVARWLQDDEMFEVRCIPLGGHACVATVAYDGPSFGSKSMGKSPLMFAPV